MKPSLSGSNHRKQPDGPARINQARAEPHAGECSYMSGAHTASPRDEELLERARGGDDRAFRLIVERYEGLVAATVIGMLGRGPEAEDVGQEVFIRLYRSLEKFRGESSLGTYVNRIAINHSLKALKRRKSWRQRFFSREDDDPGLEETTSEEPDFGESRDTIGRVQEAVRSLGPDHRAVVVLRMLEGFSTRETAEQLGIAEGTVMSRLSRAMEKLERILRE